MSAIPLPDGISKEGDVRVTAEGFWGGRLLFMPYYNDKDRKTPSDIYIADLDGTNASPLIKHVMQGKCLQTDGKYLYLSNGALFWSMEEQKNDLHLTYEVYDKEGKQVDTFQHPYSGYATSALPIGGDDGTYLILLAQKEKEMQVLYYDKKSLGSLDGDEIKFDVVAARGLGKKTLLYQELMGQQDGEGD